MFGQGCPKFVPLIEGEKFGTPELKAAIHEYADKLREHHVDTVLLSCTHYPFVRKEIEEEFGPEVTILDPAERTAQDALETWKNGGWHGRMAWAGRKCALPPTWNGDGGWRPGCWI